MAEITAPAPFRMRMTVAHGGRGLLVGLATAASGAAGGSDAILVAFIAAGSTLAAVIVGPFVTESVRKHFRRGEVDHREELITEQAAMIEHLIGELERKARRDR